MSNFGVLSFRLLNIFNLNIVGGEVSVARTHFLHLYP